MKKIIVLGLMLMMFMGIVSASSVNGDFEGSPVVKLMDNGKEITTDDVPAIIYNDRTMIPVYLLQKMGAAVTWNQSDYSVNVVFPKPEPGPTIVPSAPKKSLHDITNEMKPNGVELISRVSNGKDVDTIAYYISYTYDEFNQKTDLLSNILLNSVETDAKTTEINYLDGFILSIPTSAARDFYTGKITTKEFSDQYRVTNPGSPESTSLVQPNQTTHNNTTEQPGIKLEYMLLYSNDGKTYLGKLTSNKNDVDSIFNDYGSYGGKYSAKSIFNDYGTYGGEYSSESPFNKYATKPPMILLNGKVVGYLTLNKSKSGAVSPLGLKEYLIELGY